MCHRNDVGRKSNETLLVKDDNKQRKKSHVRMWRPRFKGVVKLHGLDGEEMLRLRLSRKTLRTTGCSVFDCSGAWSQNGTSSTLHANM